MAHWRIVQTTTGMDFGVFEAPSAKGALEALANWAEFKNYAALRRNPDGKGLRALPAEPVPGLRPFRPTHRISSCGGSARVVVADGCAYFRDGRARIPGFALDPATGTWVYRGPGWLPIELEPLQNDPTGAANAGRAPSESPAKGFDR